jgi:hypothetical protein
MDAHEREWLDQGAADGARPGASAPQFALIRVDSRRFFFRSI